MGTDVELGNEERKHYADSVLQRHTFLIIPVITTIVPKSLLVQMG